MIFLDECSDLSSVLRYIITLLNIIHIVVPIIFIIWGTIDMLKCIIEGDEKKVKENRILFIKRLIYAVLVFLVPWFVNLIITLFEGSSEWIECLKRVS